jgi:hypothetical protein
VEQLAGTFIPFFTAMGVLDMDMERTVKNVEGLTVRACLSSYIALCGAWALLAIFCASVEIFRSDGRLIPPLLISVSIGTGLILYLRGFKISVANGVLEYRDGLYRRHRLPLDQVQSVKWGNMSWHFLTEAVRVPGLIVRDRSGKQFLMLVKPFRRRDVNAVREALHAE